MTDPVLAAYRWRTNGVLIKTIATRLGPTGTGYLRSIDQIVDPTYNQGKWHTEWTPDPDAGGQVIGSDLYVTPKAIPDGVTFNPGLDFRKLPYPTAHFDVGYWDPTYAPTGGKSTSTIGKNLAAYGRDTAPNTPEALHAENSDGFRELLRVVKPGGIVLAKTMNYVWCGRLHLARHDFATLALSLGCTVEEELTHVNNGSPQDKNRTKAAKCGQCNGSGNYQASGVCPWCDNTGKIRVPSVQLHARNNSSTMYVLRTPRSPK